MDSLLPVVMLKMVKKIPKPMPVWLWT